MKREFSLAQIGIATVSLILWFVLPVFSFILLMVPLYNIMGVTLAININQLMLLPLIFCVVMIVGAIMNNRIVMIVSAALQIVLSFLILVFKRDILLGGNLKFIYDSATLLLNNSTIQDKIQQWTGAAVNGDSLRQIIDVVANYLQVGLGWILHLVLTAVYLVIAIAAPAPSSASIGKDGLSINTQTQTYTPSNNSSSTGYKHRT